MIYTCDWLVYFDRFYVNDLHHPLPTEEPITKLLQHQQLLFGLHDKKKIELCFDVLRFNGGDDTKELFVESRVLILETTFVGAESMVLILEMTFVDVESRVSITKTTFVGVESRLATISIPIISNSNQIDMLSSAPDANKPNPSLVEDADLIAPHSNTFCSPSLVNWNWDEVILISSDDDETNVNEPIALPVEDDADVEIALHHNPFLNPKLLNSYWDDVVVVPSDDDEGHAEEDIYTSVNTQVHVQNRKRVFALIDESDSDDEPYWILRIGDFELEYVMVFFLDHGLMRRGRQKSFTILKETVSHKGTIEFHVCVGAGMSSTDANNR
nr:hypothetical protein [Tanacetum cinerariifolium]